MRGSWPRPQGHSGFRTKRGLALVVVTLSALIVVGFAVNGRFVAERVRSTPVCENGTVIPNHATQPELVADCEVLLAIKSTLAGTATLNWGATTALSSWNGVTVARRNVASPKRVTRLDFRSGDLSGVIPPELGQLSALLTLQLSWNDLTGTIPPELGQLTGLTYLGLAGNRLTGTIPPELGRIGPGLQTLVLSGPRPLRSGIGLTGSIPAQLGNLTGLRFLYLDGNRLTGAIPTRFGRLKQLDLLNLARNQLTGAIPTQLGGLPKLNELYLDSNQLTGAIPSQLAGLPKLYKIQLKNNSGLSGCYPNGLDDIRYHDLNRLGLSECAADADATPETPIPTFTVTATAGAGGTIDPAGTSTHVEASEVTLTASWNDATHTFGGWGGACSGSETTCRTDAIYADLTVTAAFTPLAADRCATATDADCIRAVYLGAPDDYAQVQDIPAAKLISPDADGRYQVERGQQITVVTAAPLPTGWTRFYLQRSPLNQPQPTSHSQLIRPIGTTYTFTISEQERAATLITFNLTAARPLPIQRPGIKPELGATVTTTRFRINSSTLRYGRFDAAGPATSPGTYAFLSDPDDISTGVTTYEALRDGSTSGLLIHKSDGFGASQTQLFDEIAAGDLFEWRQADDCFVRYTVTEVKPDPGGTAPRKLLGIEWMTYAFTGCSGTIGADAEVWFRWGELGHLGGASLTAPVVHGAFQIVPEGWTGAKQEPIRGEPAGYSFTNPRGGPDIELARTLPNWREPVLPEGMVFLWASSGDEADPGYGYRARFEGGGSGIELEAETASHRRYPKKASWNNGRGVRETRIIAGRTAVVIYSPPGPAYSEFFPVTVWVYDPANEAIYSVRGRYGNLIGGEPDRVIEIARSLFEPETQQ